MAGREREPMHNVDRAWLGMDGDTNLMIINGVMMFDELIDYELFKRMIQQRMVDKFRRFRQRLVETTPGAGGYAWEDDPYFDIRSHVRRIALPAPGDTIMLQSLVSSLMSESLDRNRPLWQMYLIENYEGGCAIYSRLHHCIADGIALIQVMLSMTDSTPEISWPLAKEPSANGRPQRPSLVRPFFRTTRWALQSAARAGDLLVRGGARTLDDPGALLDRARIAGIVTAASAAVLTRLVIIPPDRPSVFRGELGTTKRAVWSDSLALDEVKQIGRTMGGTVNDVLISVLAGGLRRYMAERGDDMEGGDIRAMVPVNLRDLEGELELGNQFGMVYLGLPIGVADPVQRLFEVHRRMDILKNSPEPVVVYQVLNLLGMLPGDLATLATDYFAGKASAVLTNVPGPRNELYFIGRRLKRMMFWVPQSGDIGMGLSILSYNGAVNLGVMTDEKLVPDPECILDAFMAEFAALRQAAAAFEAARSVT